MSFPSLNKSIATSPKDIAGNGLALIQSLEQRLLGLDAHKLLGDRPAFEYDKRRNAHYAKRWASSGSWSTSTL